MDAEAPLGDGVSPVRSARAVTVAVLAVAVLALTRTPADAEARHALIVAGASGGGQYAEALGRWQRDIRTALATRYRFSSVTVLGDETATDVPKATAAAVRAAVGTLKPRLTGADLLLVILLGHGTFDGDVAKFNLVGPDLSSDEWKTLLAGLPGTLVVINTTGASAPFLPALAGRNRIIVTATDAPAQRYDTVYPEYLAQALGAVSTDLDKNGRTSLWELFSASSASVRQHYTQRGQLTTERAVLDDTGEGRGREPEALTGRAGALARATFLDPVDVSATADPERAALLQRQRMLEAEAERLKGRKGDTDPAAWSAEWGTLMVELARVSRELRRRPG